MNSDIRKFLIRLIVLSVVLFFAGWIVFKFILKDYYLKAFPFMILMFFVVTAATHIYQIILINKNFARFTRSNMLATTFKLLVYSVFSIAFLFFNSGKAIPFIVLLFILYLIYTVFEVLELTRLNRRIFKNN